MIKIEFDATNLPLALALGEALTRYGSGETTKQQITDADIEETSVAQASGRGEWVQTAQDSSDNNSNEPDDSTPAQDPNKKYDPKGVEFDAVYCGAAADPFYKSGARKDQWKRRKSVTEQSYDEWYAGKLAALSTKEGSASEQGPISTSGAFGNDGNQQQQPTPDDEIPTEMGQFMGWVSEQQAQNRLTSQDCEKAYADNGITLTDFFPPNDADKVAGYIRKVYATLKPIANANS